MLPWCSLDVSAVLHQSVRPASVMSFDNCSAWTVDDFNDVDNITTLMWHWWLNSPKISLLGYSCLEFQYLITAGKNVYFDRNPLSLCIWQSNGQMSCNIFVEIAKNKRYISTIQRVISSCNQCRQASCRNVQLLKHFCCGSMLKTFEYEWSKYPRLLFLLVLLFFLHLLLNNI